MTKTIATNKLQPNPFQPRGKIQTDDVQELAQSIKTYGILEPIVVAETPAGHQIIAGERRWRAAQLLNLDEVPIHLIKTTPKGMMEMALVENVQRVDLDPIERAQAFRQLMRNFEYTNSDLAEKVGKSPSYISNSMRLLDLPDAITDGLISGQISEGHARALSGIKDEADMVQAYKTILKENASVRRAEELARRYKQNEPVNDKQVNKPKVESEEVDKNLVKNWENSFNSFFHTESKLRLSRSNRQTKVTITLKGSPEQTQEDLERIIKLANQHQD